MTTIAQNGTNFLIFIWRYYRSGEINMDRDIKRHDIRVINMDRDTRGHDIRVYHYTMGMNYCARRKTGYWRTIA